MRILLFLALFACEKGKDSAPIDSQPETAVDTQGQDSAHPLPPNYTSAKVCGECHTRQYKEWRQSMHAYAAISPVFEAMNAKAFRDSSGEVGTFCTGCHAPVGTEQGEGGHTSVDERSELSKEGVTCSYCHSAVGHDGPIGNNNLINDPEGPLQGPFETDGSEGHLSQASEFIQSPEFCGSCHDVFSFPSLRIEEAFTEYKESPAAEENIRCQDCHMGPDPGRPADRPSGPSADGDPGDYPDREQASHFFVGPDYSLVPDWPFGEDEAANQVALSESLARTEKLLKNAIQISFVKLNPIGDKLQIEVSLNTLVKGHGFPTGFTSERQAWIEVHLTDANGDSLFKSGDLDSYGDLRDAHSRAVKEGTAEEDEQLINFQSQNLLRFGLVSELHVNETIFPFDADWIEKRNLKPGENKSFIYRTDRPDGPVSLEVSLNYRNLPPYLLRALQLDSLVPQLQIFTIDSKTVESL